MRLRPLSTLPVRLSLRLEGRSNAKAKLEQRTFLEHADDRAVKELPEVSLVSFPNPYALLGHQVSNWISGYLWSADLGLPYAGGLLTRDSDGLFNFSSSTVGGEALWREVAGTRDFDQRVLGLGRILRRLPRVRATLDEQDETSLDALRRGVHIATDRNPAAQLVRFALDQPRYDQTPAAPAIRQAVLDGCVGRRVLENEKAADFVAIHIRRPHHLGEISQQAHPDRWIDQEWYLRVVEQLRALPELRAMPIRIYSLGSPEQFDRLASLDGVQIHVNGDRDSDFADLVSSRVLVASPSSFSFTAALASKRTILARFPWWHYVPEESRWTRIAEDGSLDLHNLRRALRAGAD